MTNKIDEKIKKRFQFLHALYEHSEESQEDIIYSKLGERIGLSDEESYQISQFLLNDGLIAFVSIIDQIAITHKGMLAIENALSKPQNATEYFPPINIFIMGNVSDSNIQVGNNNQIKGDKNDRTMDAE